MVGMSHRTVGILGYAMALRKASQKPPTPPSCGMHVRALLQQPTQEHPHVKASPRPSPSKRMDGSRVILPKLAWG